MVMMIQSMMMLMLILTERSRWFLRKQRWLSPSGSSQCRNQFCSRNIIVVIIFDITIVIGVIIIA